MTIRDKVRIEFAGAPFSEAGREAHVRLAFEFSLLLDAVEQVLERQPQEGARELALAKTKLQEAYGWAVSALGKQARYTDGEGGEACGG